MTFTDAAREVLKQCGRPLHYKEITEIAIEKNLLSHVGKSPEVTMGARLAATLKKSGEDTPLIRVKPGVFALRDWDEETIKQGLEIKRSSRSKKKKDDDDKDASKSKSKGRGRGKSKGKSDDEEDDQDETEDEASDDRDDDGDDDGGDDDAAENETSDDDDDEPADKPKTRVLDDVDPEPQTPDEAKRAEIAAKAGEMFDDEDDDDQPIMKAPDEDTPSESSDGGRRRRRRRRRRGSRSGGNDGDNGQLPAYTAKPVADDALPRGPQVIELSSKDMPSLDDVAGRDLADAVVMVLSSFDRTVGAVSLRQIAETAQRHNKLGGDLQLAQSHIAASVRADNARRQRLGLRPRFRLAGGRVGLTDWMLDHDLARFERDVQQALARYREAARKAFAKKCSELPGHAFVELCLMVLERVGAQQIRPVKFPGASGVEAHFSATLHAPAGLTPGRIGVGEGMKLAVVVRKDGRDIGRERVTELRGSAHHYDAARMGWIFTAGQLLSGAKEESSVDNVMPVTLLDAPAIAEICAEYGVAVVRSEHPIAVPDVDLFEALRSS